MRTSYSALNTYKSCPLKFKYQELDKIRVKKGKEAIFGAAMHETLRYTFTKNPLFPTLAEIIDFFKKIWQERASKIELNNEEKNEYEKDAETMLTGFYKKNQPWNFNTVNLESRFNFTILDENSGEKHIIAGIMDRIDKNSDSGYEIIDYKTASRMPSKETVDRDLQLSIYHLGILTRWPQILPENIKLSLYFLKHNEKISTERFSRDTEKTQNALLSLIREILEKTEKNDFQPTPSALCDWCGYKNMCPMWKHEFKEFSISNNQFSKEELDKIIIEYLELKEAEQKNKKRLTELQAEIHEFMNAENIERVFHENEYITRKIKKAAKYDLEKVKEILEPLGFWKELQKVDETALNKLIPKLPREIQEKFKNIIKEIKKTATLTVSKIRTK